MLENLSIPSSHIFHEAVMSVIAEDPSVSYESIAKYKSLFERRFNRARKECISAKTKIPNIGIRHLVRATQRHIRAERKFMNSAENVTQQLEHQQQQQIVTVTEHLQDQQHVQIEQQHLQGQPLHIDDHQQHLQVEQQEVVIPQAQHLQVGNNQRVAIIVSNM